MFDGLLQPMHLLAFAVPVVVLYGLVRLIRAAWKRS